ncbi:DNA-directed RNA polymerase [Malassezia yamatoensis]|uniref:DNA-directed RNA polymerase n=1 Tax=Malassezia yamatoensis TaxID=253288 RepID=A0AAJ5YVC8_9BASI|nr:DNA-directed RNA polymerase [Malassezia yamatoensis]
MASSLLRLRSRACGNFAIQRHHRIAIPTLSSQHCHLHSSPKRFKPRELANAELETPPIGAFSDRLPYTQLPTPLPIDVRETQSALRRRAMKEAGQMSSEDFASSVVSSFDEAYFPTAKSVESFALLQACLSSGLIHRAHKMMCDLRQESHHRLTSMYEARDAPQMDPNYVYTSTLPLWTYNSVLHAYLMQAATTQNSKEFHIWLSRAWDLWQAMLRESLPRLDAKPDATTVATMALGIVHLAESNQYPNSERDMASLLKAVRSLHISLDSVFSSSVVQSSAEPESKVQSTESQKSSATTQDSSTFPTKFTVEPLKLSSYFRSAASQLGDTHALHELDDVERLLKQAEQRSDQEPIASATSDPLEGVAEVRPVLKNDLVHGEVKPFNLETLQESLAVMQDARHRVPDLYERQRWLEHSALDAARKRLQHDQAKLEELGMSPGGLQSKSLQAWMWDWCTKLEQYLVKEIAKLRQDVEQGQASQMDTQMLPFLTLLPPSKMAMIVVLELMRMQGVGSAFEGVKTTRALLQIGKAIENEYHATVINQHPEVFVQARTAQNLLKDQNLINMAMRRDLKAWQERCDEDSLETQLQKWTQTVRVRVGSYLVQHMMDVATVKRTAKDRDGELWEEEQPAFFSAYQYISGKKLGVIRLNEVVGKRLDKESVKETLHPRHLPMLVPPRPWLTHDSGGYFSVRTSAMRCKDSIEQSSYLRAASKNNGLEVVLAGLDVLGNTAWNINRRVFDVVLQVWNSGEALADLPPAESTDPEPVRPDADDIKAKGVYMQRMRQWTANRASNHSQRCDINYKLEIARNFLGERFYFPHNMDFRGRAYPIPPHLNHIGNDLCRGLLKFADAKPLGKIGLRWLRIHLANVYGYDKASFAEREQFAIDHEQDMRDSVTNPLDGKRWWLQADDPWQCLATCFELQAALDHPEGPENFPSQLPVHQDGTCNGLQHYAALGGDLHGAKQVNLSEGDRPSDVYSGVADLVISQLEKRAEEGDVYAKMLQGKVTRKVVKQTVMTTVYGVTFIGAKNQVLRQLIDRGDIPAEDLWHAASYLAKSIMGCIGDLFKGANLIQDWLSVSARLIAKSIPADRIEASSASYKSRSTVRTSASSSTRLPKEQMTSVIWTTALGLPIVQPYRKVKKYQVATAMQSVYIRDPNQNHEVNPTKQSSAFPPNFIHSLDATHMILTALECQSAGLVFASVHDSYWTHACDIETMSDIIRDTFVRLHSQDILVRLRNEFLERYKGYKIPTSSLTKASMVRAERELREAEANADAVASDADSPTANDPKQRRRRANEPKFVDLADVLPAIPEKGNFDVNEIKRSLYFFS